MVGYFGDLHSSGGGAGRQGKLGGSWSLCREPEVCVFCILLPYSSPPCARCCFHLLFFSVNYTCNLFSQHHPPEQ